ncbi:MAG: histidinol-phosphate transaminase [Pseudomonadota bacterium]
MSDVLGLARPEIVALHAYEPAAFADDCIRLNANEVPWRNCGDRSGRGLNRYPEHRPRALEQVLAGLYGVAADEVLVTRGSSEAIDLLVRSFCRAGRDNVVICPPTFGMYGVYADIQGAGIRRVPLTAAPDFQADVDTLLESWSGADKVLFLTSPNNPTGNALDCAHLDALVDGLSGRGLIVIDAAYQEFSTAPDPVQRYRGAEHVVVLRTLSKAFGLAGARCGALLATPAVVRLLAGVIAPYATPTPTVEAVLAALEEPSLADSRARIRSLVDERDRFAAKLDALGCIDTVHASDANFLLVATTEPDRVLARARAAGLLLRDFSGSAALPGCLRITVGSRAENEALLDALRERGR